MKQSLTSKACPAGALPSARLCSPVLSPVPARGARARLLRSGKREMQLQDRDDAKAEGRAQPLLRWPGRRAGGALDLEDRFGGQALIKTFCMKLKKLRSVSV